MTIRPKIERFLDENIPSCSSPDEGTLIYFDNEGVLYSDSDQDLCWKAIYGTTGLHCCYRCESQALVHKPIYEIYTLCLEDEGTSDWLCFECLDCGLEVGIGWRPREDWN